MPLVRAPSSLPRPPWPHSCSPTRSSPPPSCATALMPARPRRTRGAGSHGDGGGAVAAVAGAGSAARGRARRWRRDAPPVQGRPSRVERAGVRGRAVSAGDVREVPEEGSSGLGAGGVGSQRRGGPPALLTRWRVGRWSWKCWWHGSPPDLRRRWRRAGRRRAPPPRRRFGRAEVGIDRQGGRKKRGEKWG